MKAPHSPTVVINDQVYSRDGRRRRRETNQYRVIEAAVELIKEGTPVPTAGEVAERANVSERSIFRYFDDVDALLHAAVDSEIDAALSSDLVVPAPPAPSTERLSVFVDTRVSLYLALEAIIRSLRVRMAHAPVAAGPWTKVAERLRAQSEALVSHEAPQSETSNDGQVADLVEVLSSCDAYFLLASMRGHDEAVATMEAGLATLLQPA